MKRVLLALIFVAVSILPIFAVPASPAFADSWMAGWDYRKSMTLNASADGALTNYQLPIRIYRSDGADGTEAMGTVTAGKVYVSTKCEADYDDIRFTTDDGTTLLDYWIEEYDVNDATIWVEFDSIPDSGNVNFYIYYSNSGASAISDGDDTFLLFDHFLGDSLNLDKWSAKYLESSSGGSYSVSDSILTVTQTASSGVHITYLVYSDTTYEYPRRIRLNMSVPTYTATNGRNRYSAGGFQSSTDAVRDEISIAASESTTAHYSDYVCREDANRTGIALSPDITEYHTYLISQFSDSSIKFDYDNNYEGETTTNIITDTVPCGFVVRAYGTTYPAQITADWVAVMNITANEPEWGAWGSEETEPSLVLTIASSAGGNVTTPGEGNFNYAINETVNISATADTCYHFVNWTGDTATIANVSAASTTINMSTTNKSITANFAIDTFTLTYTAGAGGIITGTTPQTVNCGSNGSEVTATPNSCYYFVDWSDAVATASRTDLNISADLSVTANFASYTYEPPTTLTCNPSSTSIELNWTLGANTSAAYIRYKIGSYPTTLFDGNMLGTITGDNYIHTGLTSGNSYYYKVWGVNGNCISTNSTTVLCTTYYGAGAGATPDAPTEPDNWTGQFDDTELADLPVYEFGNLVADEGGIPYATFWGLGIMGAMIIIALICYNKTHNVFLTCLSITIGLLALGALGVIPFFAVGLFVIMSLVVTVREGREV